MGASDGCKCRARSRTYFGRAARVALHVAENAAATETVANAMQKGTFVMALVAG